MARFRKESVINMSEDIAMVASYLCKKLGDSEAQCLRHTTYSKMSETEIIPADVGWNRMMSKEEELREWVDKIVKKGELGAVGDAPPDLLQELGLTEEDMHVEGDVEEDTCMGGLEVVEDVDEDDGFLDNDILLPSASPKSVYYCHCISNIGQHWQEQGTAGAAAGDMLPAMAHRPQMRDAARMAHVKSLLHCMQLT